MASTTIAIFRRCSCRSILSAALLCSCRMYQVSYVRIGLLVKKNVIAKLLVDHLGKLGQLFDRSGAEGQIGFGGKIVGVAGEVQRLGNEAWKLGRLHAGNDQDDMGKSRSKIGSRTQVDGHLGATAGLEARSPGCGRRRLKARNQMAPIDRQNGTRHI
jgi:hypothetical protein